MIIRNRYDIGQRVFTLHENMVFRCKIIKITMSESGVRYDLAYKINKVGKIIVRYEKNVFATKEQLKESL